MSGKLTIDRGIYLIDDETSIYRFFAYDSDWQSPAPVENEANKRQIDGYKRIFRVGRVKTFRHLAPRRADDWLWRPTLRWSVV